MAGLQREKQKVMIKKNLIVFMLLSSFLYITIYLFPTSVISLTRFWTTPYNLSLPLLSFLAKEGKVLCWTSKWGQVRSGSGGASLILMAF